MISRGSADPIGSIDPIGSTRSGRSSLQNHQMWVLFGQILDHHFPPILTQIGTNLSKKRVPEGYSPLQIYYPKNEHFLDQKWLIFDPDPKKSGGRRRPKNTLQYKFLDNSTNPYCYNGGSPRARAKQNPSKSLILGHFWTISGPPPEPP